MTSITRNHKSGSVVQDRNLQQNLSTTKFESIFNFNVLSAMLDLTLHELNLTLHGLNLTSNELKLTLCGLDLSYVWVTSSFALHLAPCVGLNLTSCWLNIIQQVTEGNLVWKKN